MAMCGHCAEAWKLGHRCESGLREIYRGMRAADRGTSDDTSPENPEISTLEAQGVTRADSRKRPGADVLAGLVKELRKACFAVDRHSDRCKGCVKRRERRNHSLLTYEPTRQCRTAVALQKEERAAALAVRQEEAK